MYKTGLCGTYPMLKGILNKGYEYHWGDHGVAVLGNVCDEVNIYIVGHPQSHKADVIANKVYFVVYGDFRPFIFV